MEKSEGMVPPECLLRWPSNSCTFIWRSRFLLPVHPALPKEFLWFIGRASPGYRASPKPTFTYSIATPVLPNLTFLSIPGVSRPRIWYPTKPLQTPHCGEPCTCRHCTFNGCSAISYSLPSTIHTRTQLLRPPDSLLLECFIEIFPEICLIGYSKALC